MRLARAGMWVLTLWLPVAFAATFHVGVHRYNREHPLKVYPAPAWLAMQNIGRCR